MKWTLWQKIRFAWNVISLTFYCFYCVFFLLMGLGNKVVNWILVGSTAAYFLLFIITWAVRGRKGKRITNMSKRVYKVTRRLTLLINTVITGGAIINMSGFGGKIFVSICAFVLIGNLALNILWLIFIHQMERRHKEEIQAVKNGAQQFASKVKSLFKKESEKPSETGEDAGAIKETQEEDITQS